MSSHKKKLPQEADPVEISAIETSELFEMEHIRFL